MNCDEINPLIEAYFDGEMDLVRHLEIESHLKSCATCGVRLQGLEKLRGTLRSSALRYDAPSSLQNWARSQMAKPEKISFMAGWNASRVWRPLAAVAMIAILVGGPLIFKRVSNDREADDVVSAHVRSLMAGHLTDVASTDQHTVKPWFSGKIDFAPEARDLSEFSFPLVGGRLDYLAERPVAALVYRHNQHFINLFMWPSSKKRDGDSETFIKRGFNLVRWTKGDMIYWTVSDLNAKELAQFAQIFQTQVLQP